MFASIQLASSLRGSWKHGGPLQDNLYMMWASDWLREPTFIGGALWILM
jgi:hypothetical protein